MTSFGRHDGVMTEQTRQIDPTATRERALALDDPRYGFAEVTRALDELISTTPASELDQPTPCPDFTVGVLLDHIVMVMRRVAAVGWGQHWSTVEQEAAPPGVVDIEAFRAAAHDVHQVWADDSRLEQLFEVPWGTLPGAPVLYGYTGELAVHGWDLATATGREFEVADDALGGAVAAIRQIPAEGRGTDVPFDPVVDPGPDASAVLQMAGWTGRRVT